MRNSKNSANSDDLSARPEAISVPQTIEVHIANEIHPFDLINEIALDYDYRSHVVPIYGRGETVESLELQHKSNKMYFDLELNIVDPTDIDEVKFNERLIQRNACRLDVVKMEDGLLDKEKIRQIILWRREVQQHKIMDEMEQVLGKPINPGTTCLASLRSQLNEMAESVLFYDQQPPEYMNIGYGLRNFVLPREKVIERLTIMDLRNARRIAEKRVTGDCIAVTTPSKRNLIIHDLVKELKMLEAEMQLPEEVPERCIRHIERSGSFMDPEYFASDISIHHVRKFFVSQFLAAKGDRLTFVKLASDSIKYLIRGGQLWESVQRTGFESDDRLPDMEEFLRRIDSSLEDLQGGKANVKTISLMETLNSGRNSGFSETFFQGLIEFYDFLDQTFENVDNVEALLIGLTQRLASEADEIERRSLQEIILGVQMRSLLSRTIKLTLSSDDK